MERKSIIKEILLLVLSTFLLFFCSLVANAQSTEVWPGDANENGVVNHVDLLYLGLNLGKQGLARDSVSIEWTGQSATEWNTGNSMVPNACHADCNGNSVVEIADRQAIDLNYGWTRPTVFPDSSSLNRTSARAAPLTFYFNEEPLVAGNTDTIFFDLGSEAVPVDSLMGFSATMLLDEDLVDSAYFWVDPEWFEIDRENLILINHYEAGRLEVAVTRTDGLDTRRAEGGLGGVVVVMADNLKQSVRIDSLNLRFDDALGLTSQFGIAEFEIVPSIAKVYSSDLALDALIYPVPAQDMLNIKLVSLYQGEAAGTLYNAQGRMVREFTVTEDLLQLQRDGLPGGNYLLTLRRGEDLYHRWIQFYH